MSLATVRTKVDDWLTPKWANLQTKQEQFKTAHGHYFQGLWTHAAEVTETDALEDGPLPDNLADKPTDQPHDWRDFIGAALDAVPFPCRLRIDVYDGPQGDGWCATLQVKYSGNVYERSAQVGPEDWRQHNWQKLDVTETP